VLYGGKRSRNHSLPIRYFEIQFLGTFSIVNKTLLMDLYLKRYEYFIAIYYKNGFDPSLLFFPVIKFQILGISLLASSGNPVSGFFLTIGVGSSSPVMTP